MSERYAPNPYRAMQLAGDDLALLGLVAWLYREAHTARWGWLRLTIRDLAGRARTSTKAVETLLDDMVERGLADREIVRSGGRAEGTRLRLLDPSEGGDMEGGWRETPRETPRPAKRAAPQPSRDMAGDMEHGSRETSTTDLTDPEQTDVSVVSAGAPEVALAELVALQEADEPQHGMAQPKDRTALRRALGRGVLPEALRALWAWSAVSQDPIVAGCRQGWRRWSSLLKPPDGDARVSAAVAWDRAGRPTDAPARAGPGPPRSRADAFDEALRRDAERLMGRGDGGRNSNPDVLGGPSGGWPDSALE